MKNIHTKLTLPEDLYTMLQEESKKYPNWSVCLRDILRTHFVHRDLREEFSKLDKFKEKD